MKFVSYKNTGLIPSIEGDFGITREMVSSCLTSRFIGNDLVINDVLRLHAADLWQAAGCNWHFDHRDEDLRWALENITFRKPLKMETRQMLLSNSHTIAVVGWIEGNEKPTTIIPATESIPAGFTPVWFLLYETLGYVSSSY